MTDVADPRSLVHGEADVAVLSDGRLAGVDAHPDPDDARSGHSWWSTARWASIAACTAAPALVKTAKNESPWRSISTPPAASNACRSSSLWSESRLP